MIEWIHQEEAFCEGSFQSAFFRDEENSSRLSIGVKSPELMECAERCVEAFNRLTQAEIREICQKIIACARESAGEGFELPDGEDPLEILDSCWFTTLYVNMLSREDALAYVVEGEGDWGDAIGFAVENGRVSYVGADYFACMKDEA